MFSDTGHYKPQVRFSSKGYTLIEVLVAMAIFSSMLMLAGVALHQGLKQYHGLAEKGIGFWEYAKEIWIDKSFNSTIDYYVHTRSDGWFPYFKGSQDGISYISLAPLAGEVPVVAWIRNEAEANGMRSLVYYELPVYTKSYEEIERDYIFGDYKKGRTIKLLEGVEGIEFSFYGYDFLGRKYGWYKNFDGSKMKILPSSIVISYHRNGKKDRLVFGVHVNSFLKMTYNDVYIKP
ncbi:MAG: prepilin-type N-terminal cleavage/methylation domain-containing protein [Deltaproteobacteria bacterium]|nr:prepilin-type N-terminal cleavage/methylation domain-containing protein [Deltaproteobacteria bacterium]